MKNWYKMSSNLPPITDVAIKDETGKVWSLPKPNRHWDVLSEIFREGHEGKEMGFIAGDQFVDRLTAWHHAHANNQILPPYNPVNPNERRWDLEPSDVPGELFSEDIW